jgi:hypothetical protein
MSNTEIFNYICDRVRAIEKDTEEFGFDIEDMDDWTQGNYEAYRHLQALLMQP